MRREIHGGSTQLSSRQRLATDEPHRAGLLRRSRTAWHVDDIIARFDEWLADQHVSAARRVTYRVHVERCLRWHAGRPDASAARIQWRYYTQLRDHGATEAELEIVRTSLALLRHVTEPRTTWFGGRCELEGAG
jgi:hypothetical protein